MPVSTTSAILAAYLSEFVAALFAAAVAFSFRRPFRRPDLAQWGLAWASAAVFSGLGFLNNGLTWSPAELTVMRAVARSAGFFEAACLLGAASTLVGGGVSLGLRRAAILAPALGISTALASDQPLSPVVSQLLRAAASVCVGAAALVAAAFLLGRKPAAPVVGIRLMTAGLSLYGAMKLFSPTTLSRLGVLDVGAGPALVLGFSLAPATFALGAAISLLEDRERLLAGERDRLRVSEQKFATLFRSSPDPVMLSQPMEGGRIMAVNGAFETLFGWSSAEAVGKTTVELGLFEERARAELLAEGTPTGRLRNREAVLFDQAGRPVSVEISAEVVEIGGQPCVLSVLRDVTESKRAQEALRRNEELFRTVVEDQTEMISRWKPDGTRTFVNQAYCRAFGGGADHIGRSFLPELTDEYRKTLLARVASLTPSEPLAAHVLERLGPAGERRFQEWTDRGIFDAEGRLVEVQSTGWDGTERREAEQRLRESEERLRRISEASFEGIAFSEHGVLQDVNEQFAEMLGYRVPELIGKPVIELVAPEHRALVEARIRGGSTQSYAHLAQRKDGTILPVETRARLLRTGDRVLRVTAVRDMSERARLEGELQKRQRMAAVGELVAGVAHEVRTPLFGISANLDVYERHLETPEDKREFFAALRVQVQRLNSLMSDLLDYGRPRALRFTRGDIASIVGKAVRSCARQAELAGVGIREDYAAGLVAFDRDPERLEQVFQNLISNALHLSPRGGVVQVSVSQVSDPPGVICAVEDQGPGLPEGSASLLFEPFFSKRKGGTGLGLPIVQRIVEQHGGSVRADNRDGGGAVFTVFLPAPEAQAA